MYELPLVYLKKNEDRRIRAGHLWVFSNEIDTNKTSLKQFQPGEEVILLAADKSFLGVGFINPHSLITVRIISRQRSSRFDSLFLKKRIAQAFALRNRLFDKPYYRLIFGESDFIPGLVIDRFDQYLVVQSNTAGTDKKIDAILTALIEILPETKGILLKNDSSTRRLEQLEEVVKPLTAKFLFSSRLKKTTPFFMPPWNRAKKQDGFTITV
jgi:23S rRNA (cytosine1962-C5)-methyltransferase